MSNFKAKGGRFKIAISLELLLFFMPKVLHSQGTWNLAKCSVCVRNGYDGDSEIVSELAMIYIAPISKIESEAITDRIKIYFVDQDGTNNCTSWMF